MKQRRFLLAMVFLSGISASTMAHAAVKNTKAVMAPVGINLLGCSNVAPNARLRLHITNLESSKPVDINVDALQANESRVYLPIGAYSINAAIDDCNQSAVVSVVSTHLQSVMLIGRRGALLLGAPTSIAGRLPVAGAIVALVYKHRAGGNGDCQSPEGFLQIPAVVQGESYFAGPIPDGEVTIRIYDQTWRRWIDVATAIVHPKGPLRNIFRDITQADLKNGTVGGV